jgi:hypothetical protein
MVCLAGTELHPELQRQLTNACHSGGAKGGKSPCWEKSSVPGWKGFLKTPGKEPVEFSVTNEKAQGSQIWDQDSSTWYWHMLRRALKYTASSSPVVQWFHWGHYPFLLESLLCFLDQELWNSWVQMQIITSVAKNVGSGVQGFNDGCAVQLLPWEMCFPL